VTTKNLLKLAFLVALTASMSWGTPTTLNFNSFAVGITSTAALNAVTLPGVEFEITDSGSNPFTTVSIFENAPMGRSLAFTSCGANATPSMAACQALGTTPISLNIWFRNTAGGPVIGTIASALSFFMSDTEGNYTFRWYNTANGLLGTTVISTGAAQAATFNGFSGSPIGRIEVVDVGRDGFVLDNLTFEHIPEPSTYVLIGSALAFVGVLRRRRII